MTCTFSSCGFWYILDVLVLSRASVDDGHLSGHARFSLSHLECDITESVPETVLLDLLGR